MCSYLNLQIMLILNCFTANRIYLVYAYDSSDREFLDNPGVVVGIFIQKLDKHDLVAVGIAISVEKVVTACAPLVKQFRGSKMVKHDLEKYSVVADVDSKEQERMVSSVSCFTMDGTSSKMGTSSTGKGFIGLLEIEKPFEMKTTKFATVTSIQWDIKMRCKLYYYKDEMDPTVSYTLQSFYVVPISRKNSCKEFALAETGIEPMTNQICGFPLHRDSPPCDAVVPGSPVLCSGSLLVGLTENSSFSTLAGRCFFLVDAVTVGSISHRLPVTGPATSSNPQIWLVALLAVTILYQDSSTTLVI